MSDTRTLRNYEPVRTLRNYEPVRGMRFTTVNSITEGWSKPIPVVLEKGGVPEDLTGDTITAVITGADGVAVDTTGDVTVVSALHGLVTLTPDAADFVAANSPYTVRFKGTLGGDHYWPQGSPELMHVTEQ